MFSQIPACGGSGLSGLEILQQGETTWGDHLRKTFDAFGWTVGERKMDIAGTGPQMEYLLRNQDVVIANVLSNASGALVAGGTVEHWVQVTDVRSTSEKDGSTIWEVKYLNPADNGAVHTLRISPEEIPQYFAGGLVAASPR